MTEAQHRKAIIAACQALDRDGLNRGASGNVSVRHGDTMLITPSAVAYDDLKPGMIAKMPLAPDAESWTGSHTPSSEWRFHRDILLARPDAGAVVHTHAPWSTVLSIARRPIPAIHYMMAAFGGNEIPVADYACYGTAELSANIISALGRMNGCLMANHGMVVCGPDLTRAMWLAGELEALAHQHYHTLCIGGGHILAPDQIAETARGFESYGVRAKNDT